MCIINRKVCVAYFLAEWSLACFFPVVFMADLKAPVPTSITPVSENCFWFEETASQVCVFLVTVSVPWIEGSLRRTKHFYQYRYVKLCVGMFVSQVVVWIKYPLVMKSCDSTIKVTWCILVCEVIYFEYQRLWSEIMWHADTLYEIPACEVV